MRFKLKNGGQIEVSGIREIVVNVERNGIRQTPTSVWKRHKSGRWLKYEMNNQKKVLGGMDDRDMQVMISMSTGVPFVHVWFSGSVCNITTDVKIFEATVGKSVARLINAFKGGIYA
jgi:hypothetical protein